MGVEPFLLASAMKMVVSQRLAKKLCQNCKEPVILAPHVKKKVETILKPIMEESELASLTFYEGK